MIRRFYDWLMAPRRCAQMDEGTETRALRLREMKKIRKENLRAQDRADHRISSDPPRGRW